MRTATVHIRIEPSAGTAIQELVPALTGHLSGDVVVLPSSLDRHDAFAEATAAVLPPATRVEILVPVSGSAAHKAWITPMVLGNWRDVPIHVPAAKMESVLLPGSLAHANGRIVVTDVVEVAREGPFALDLVGRYAHPRQRMRLVANAERDAIAAEISSAVRMDLYVICLSLRQGSIVCATTDPIAAELVALAMSERCLGALRSFTGPWEDPVVQRATELNIGVALPAYIRLIPTGSEAAAAWADDVLTHIRLRLGIPDTRPTGGRR